MKTKFVQSLIITIIINLSILTLLIVLLEFGYRILSFAKSCFNKCDSSRFEIIQKSRKRSRHPAGINQYNKFLGYVPGKNLIKVIKASSWNNIKVTTDKHGIRNSLNNQRSLPNVLTVGDSFAFGDQVNDGDTWQLCFNNKVKTHNFINAGVAGYGTAQSVLRAKSLFNIYNPEKIIIQTLVRYNLMRDQLDIRDEFVKPYLTMSEE